MLLRIRRTKRKSGEEELCKLLLKGVLSLRQLHCQRYRHILSLVLGRTKRCTNLQAPPTAIYRPLKPTSTSHNALIIGPPTTKDLQIRYPIIPTSTLISNPPTSRKKKRRRHGTNPTPHPHPPARFYSPAAELGGKSRGYGLGWRVALDPNDVADRGRYVRAKMGRGVFDPWGTSTRVGR